MMYEMIVGMTPFYDGVVDQVSRVVYLCLIVQRTPRADIPNILSRKNSTRWVSSKIFAEVVSIFQTKCLTMQKISSNGC